MKRKKKSHPEPDKNKVADADFKSASCCEIGLGWCDPQPPEGLPQVSDSDYERQEGEVEGGLRPWLSVVRGLQGWGWSWPPPGIPEVSPG
jgi:hypothetical protein